MTPSVPGAYQDRGFHLDQSNFLLAAGYNTFATVPVDFSTNGIIRVTGQCRYNGVDNINNYIDQSWSYTRASVGAVTLSAPVINNSGSQAVADVVLQAVVTGTDTVALQARLANVTADNGNFVLKVTHASRLNGLF